MKKLLLVGIITITHSTMIRACELPSDLMEKIGHQIWQNEASKREDLLTFWNSQEPFPSLGIGHFIWIPQGRECLYTQTFPDLCNHLSTNNVLLPKWLKEALSKGAPWKDRDTFYQDTVRLAELRQLLVGTIALQTQFIIQRSQLKLAEIIAATPTDLQAKLSSRIELMKTLPQGQYALVDYLNFKGDGLNPHEVINGEPWGLAGVLADMPDTVTAENILRAFTATAAQKLVMLAQGSRDFKAVQYLPGWMNRLKTYHDPQAFS